MPWNKPAALGLQLDRCDVCGDKYHRKDLVRTQVEFLEQTHENYLSYSSYDSSYWTVDDASDVTTTTLASYGVDCDATRLSLDDSNNLTYINGVKTWQGSGTYRMNTLSPSFSSSGNMTFSAHVGPYEQEQNPELTIVLGITNSAGSVKQVIRTWGAINAMTRVWFTESKQTLEDYGLGGGSYNQYYYVGVTPTVATAKWWIDKAQLEANTTNDEPEIFRTTSGARSRVTADTGMVTSRKVCPTCRETVLSKSERFGRTDESPVDEPVDTWNQEF
jgi:hypothetical protein